MVCIFFFFFKQKTAYEMRISDWSSDVCSSDLLWPRGHDELERGPLWPARAQRLWRLEKRGRRPRPHAGKRRRRARYRGQCGVALCAVADDRRPHKGRDGGGLHARSRGHAEIGSASCRESVWKYV